MIFSKNLVNKHQDHSKVTEASVFGSWELFFSLKNKPCLSSETTIFVESQKKSVKFCFPVPAKIVAKEFVGFFQKSDFHKTKFEGESKGLPLLWVIQLVSATTFTNNS